MSDSKRNGLLLGLMALPLIAACSDAPSSTGTAASLVEPAKQVVQERPVPEKPLLEVYKSPTCGCCEKWITHLEGEGFAAATRHPADMAAIKDKFGITPNYRSCHTAVSTNGYVFEGHVPGKYIRQFLAETPEDAIGLAVPAMPVGSPGMEVGGEFTPYQVLLLKKDGSSELYAAVTQPGDQ